MAGQRVGYRPRGLSPARVAGSRPGQAGLVGVAAGTLVLLLAGCQGSGGAGPSDPVPTAAPRARTYGAEEMVVAREAARRVQAFETRNGEILATGRATPQAEAFYRDSLLHWRPSWARLQSYERRGIEVARGPAVLSTTVASVQSFQDNAAEVVLTRCVDRSAVSMTRAGVPLPAVRGEPVLQEVVVHRSENRTWRIGAVTTTTRSCT